MALKFGEDAEEGKLKEGCRVPGVDGDGDGVVPSPSSCGLDAVPVPAPVPVLPPNLRSLNPSFAFDAAFLSHEATTFAAPGGAKCSASRCAFRMASEGCGCPQTGQLKFIFRSIILSTAAAHYSLSC